MTESEQIRFPFSASLFLFCKEILIKKSCGQKVTDQEVGTLLSFDPADCTHWKHGRKNIRSIKSLNTLSTRLEIDTKLLSDVSVGRMTVNQALHEYEGYGVFDCPLEVRAKLLEYAITISRKSDIKALPVYPNELVEAMNLEYDTNTEMSFAEVSFSETTKRFDQFKALAYSYLHKENIREELQVPLTDNVLNALTLFLIMPTHLLQLAWSKCDPAFSNLEQLSRIFWVGRSLVNVRVKDFLTYGN